MGVIIGAAGVIDWNQPNTAMAWAFVAALTGFFLSIALYWLIVSFNRPKFLVPPRHRNEPGGVRHRLAAMARGAVLVACEG